jgi:hypothetical protein
MLWHFLCCIIGNPFTMKNLVFLLFGLFFFGATQAQNPDSTTTVRIEIVEGDTFIVYHLDKFLFKNMDSEADRKAFEKLVYNVKVAMPYAKLAAFRLQMMEDNLHLIKSKREKKKYIKATEQAIKDEFMEPLNKLTVSQGKLLLKLIHRETGMTTYEILKDFRGSATTFFWGMIAKKYDADIRVQYDPIEDYQIEYIIEKFNLE